MASAGPKPIKGAFSKGTLALPRGVRQVDIAERAGVTQKTVSRWLAGERGAPPKLFDVIAELADEAGAKRVARAIGVQR